MKRLTTENCLALLKEGEFGSSITGAAESVAVVLTQSWCPQWGWMRAYLSSLPPDEGREVFWVEYDLENFFEPFMKFKETVFGNDQVPYVRYYRGGKLAAESNFIDRGGFLRRLQG
ncbi:MAG: hypothetical protein ABSF43_03860 [Rectinemataceae bacterium]|jgi:hypothetical protein